MKQVLKFNLRLKRNKRVKIKLKENTTKNNWLFSKKEIKYNGN